MLLASEANYLTRSRSANSVNCLLWTRLVCASYRSNELSLRLSVFKYAPVNYKLVGIVLLRHSAASPWFTMCFKCFNVLIFCNFFRCSACAFDMCLLNYLLTYLITATVIMIPAYTNSFDGAAVCRELRLLPPPRSKLKLPQTPSWIWKRRGRKEGMERGKKREKEERRG